MISINTIRQLADQLYGENNYSLNYDYKKIRHADGRVSKTGQKVYQIVRSTVSSKDGTKTYFKTDWKTAREHVDSLNFFLS